MEESVIALWASITRDDSSSAQLMILLTAAIMAIDCDEDLTRTDE